jgi:hypothetical protein
MCLLNLVLAQKPAKNDRRQIAKARSITDVDLAESRHIKPHEKEKSKVERQRKWKQKKEHCRDWGYVLNGAIYVACYVLESALVPSSDGLVV